MESEGDVQTEIEQKENEDSSEECTCHFNLFREEYDNKNTKLEDKLKSLKETMSLLKSQLNEEKEAWKKEINEALKIAQSASTCACDYEHGQKEASIMCESVEPTLNEISLLDFEQKLSCYQDALNKAHLERRKFLKRQIAANAYKQRLREVEEMCSMELRKVQQHAQYLQPLQKLVSEWSYKEPNRFENIENFDEELTGKKEQFLDAQSSIEASEEIPKQGFLTMEALENKINLDFKELAMQISPLTSNALGNDDEELRTKRIQSMTWYNNEMGHQIL